MGLLANPGKAHCGAALHRAAEMLAAAGCEVLTDQATSGLARLRCPVLPTAAALAAQCQLLLVFGGDGTMLRAVRDLEGSSTPIMGVNVGGLGFLTAVSSRDMETALGQVLGGHYEIDARPLIKAEADFPGGPASARALNDFVIHRAAGSRLIDLDVYVNGEELTRYRCDGLIISSPTGSTAYSLAAGGAIVEPAAEVFTLTPICPHTLSNRSVILNLSSTIVVKALGSRPQVQISGDGEILFDFPPGGGVVITRSRRMVRLARLPGVTFFRTLRHKLNWSGSHV